MTHMGACALCQSHATQEYHSTYLGHPISFATNWITGTRHYHSNEWAADTLVGIRDRIRNHEGLEPLPRR